MSAHATGAVAIIPVRVDSQRLPGKALLSETGRPLFLHTCERAVEAGCFDQVVVATDSDEVAAAARDAGLVVVMTTEKPRTGSERCAEALEQLPDARMIVDVQGDWPQVEPSDLARMVAVMDGEKHPIVTLATPLTDPAKTADPNVVKVVRDRASNALYFSRWAVPYSRSEANGGDAPQRHRHIGVYGFQRDVLARIPELPSSGLDEIEGLEQLRFLENGIAIHVLDATGDPWGIETRSDYDAFVAKGEG